MIRMKISKEGELTMTVALPVKGLMNRREKEMSLGHPRVLCDNDLIRRAMFRVYDHLAEVRGIVGLEAKELTEAQRQLVPAVEIEN